MWKTSIGKLIKKLKSCEKRLKITKKETKKTKDFLKMLSFLNPKKLVYFDETRIYKYFQGNLDTLQKKKKFTEKSAEKNLKEQVMDVKYVPKECYTEKLPDKFYQYTVVDEALQERFIYHCKEQTSYSTLDFTKRAINYIGYKPKTIQIDNSGEFTYITRTNKIHSFDITRKA